MSVKLRLLLVIGLLSLFLFSLAGAKITVAFADRERAKAAFLAIPDRIAMSTATQLLGGDMSVVYGALFGSNRLEGAEDLTFTEDLAARDRRIDSVVSSIKSGSAREILARIVAEHRSQRDGALFQARKPAMTRDMKTAHDWRATSISRLESLHGATVDLIPLSIVIDPEMDNFVAALEVLDRIARETAISATSVTGFVASRAYLGIENAVVMGEEVTKISDDLSLLRNYLIRDTKGNLSGTAKTLADSYHSDFKATVLQIIANGAGSQGDPSQLNRWQETTAGFREAQSDLSGLLSERLSEHLSGVQSAATNALIVTGVAGFLSGLLVLGSIITINRDIARPLAIGVGALSDLTSGSLEIDVSALPSKHEFGELRIALEGLSVMLVEAEEMREKAKQRRLAAERQKEEEAAAERARILEERENERAAREEEERQLREQSAAVQAVNDVASFCAAGDFTKRLDEAGHQGMVLGLFQNINAIGVAAHDGLSEIESILAQMAEGDFRPRRNANSGGAFGRIIEGSRRTKESLAGAIAKASKGAADIKDSSTQIASSTQILSHQTSASADTIRSIAAAMTEIVAATEETAKSAETGRKKAETSEAEVMRGREIMARMSEAMNDIESCAGNIEKTVQTVQDLAMQTERVGGGGPRRRFGPGFCGCRIGGSLTRAAICRGREDHSGPHYAKYGRRESRRSAGHGNVQNFRNGGKGDR